MTTTAGKTKGTLDYYAVLGVSTDATLDEIESRYQELIRYLDSESVPPSLREWADRETALLDEAYAILSDPERRAALAEAPAARSPEKAAAPAPAGKPAPPSALQALFNGVPWTLAAILAATAAVALAVGLFGGGLLSGKGEDGAPAAAEQQSSLAAIDTERVSELVALVQEDPQNLEALFELGETYFLAGEWQAAVDWFGRVLEIDPGNVHARTDVGTANFNLGNYEDARASWLTGLEAAPDDAQLHYNMGFLYANTEPADYQSAVSEWQMVLQLAPGSDLASTAQVHLDSLAALAAQASPAASPVETAAPATP
jgi:tetratricopeptide (TPR) repeat protein